MNTQEVRKEILKSAGINELSNSDFMVQAMLSFSQNLFDEMTQLTRDTYIRTATSLSQVINLAHNLNYNPRRVETYKVLACLSVSERYKDSVEYESYIMYEEETLVRHQGNLFEKRKDEYDLILGSGWKIVSEWAEEDIVIPIYSLFSAGSVSYHNVDLYIINRGKTYLNALLYEGTLLELTTGDLDINELVELPGVGIASKTLKALDEITNVEVLLIEDLGKLPPDLRSCYALTYERSGVEIYNFYPKENILANKTIKWLKTSREEGFVGSDVLTFPDLFLFHDESYGYIEEEGVSSIKTGASSGLSGRSLTSLQKSFNFLRSFYSYSSIIEGASGRVSYTATGDDKKLLSEREIADLKKEINRNRPIGASIEYTSPFINKVVLLANIRLRVGVSKEAVLNSRIIQKFNTLLNFDKTFRVYEFINELYPLNLVESADVFPCLVFDIPPLAQGDQLFVQTNVPLKNVNVKVLTKSNLILNLDQYGSDLAISYEMGFPGFQIDLLTAKFQANELKVLVEFELTIPVPDEITLFDLDHNTSYSLWRFL